MTLQLTARIVELQQRVAARLAEIGYADPQSAERLARHLAEIAVLGSAFAESTLPLFLQLDPDRRTTLAQLSVSIKCDLEELHDALTDIDSDMRQLMHFLNPEMHP